MELKVVRTSSGAQLPTQSKPGDAGLDLYVAETELVRPRQVVDIHTHIAVEFPRGWFGRIVGRSSTMRQRQLLVIEGIIDTGYRGELFIGVYNPTHKQIKVSSGERIAQMLIHRNWVDVFVQSAIASEEGLRITEVCGLSESERGDRGFGSTGE